ncbi:MAG: hypothetical protein K6E40_12005, partial [Desulfovibrio sp.]|nr:hypothetical protein [Desulfovibrio sp.]
QTGGALLEAPQHSVDDADMDTPKAPLSARIADTASAIRKACASHARRCCTNAHLLWPLALTLAFGAGATSTQWMDAWLQKAMLADRAQVEAAADPAPNARVLRDAEPAGKVQASASGTGLVSGLKDNMAERLADILAAPLTVSPTQDSQDARPFPDGWRDRQGMPGQHGQQGQQGQQLQPAQSAQNAQSVQRANKAQSAQHTKGDKACGTRNGNQAGPGSQASQASGQFIQVSQSSGQTSDSSVSTLSTSDSRDSRASHGIRESGDNGDATRANRSASSGQAEAGGRKALDQRQGLGKALVQAPLQSGDIPKPAGPKGSLGETARLLGEAEAIKLKTRLAKEEAACLKAQIETARLRRELAAADQHSAAGAHATLQARTPRDAATGDAPSDAAGNAPDVQSSGTSGASQATAAPARPAGSATGATAAGTAHPAPQASPALALHSLGRIVSIQDIGGTLTAAVRTPSGALAMLKPGTRWAGGRVTAVTPRGLRLKLGARTIAVPF